MFNSRFDFGQSGYFLQDEDFNVRLMKQFDLSNDELRSSWLRKVLPQKIHFYRTHVKKYKSDFQNLDISRCFVYNKKDKMHVLCKKTQK